MDLNQLKDFQLLGREFYSRDTAKVAKELLENLCKIQQYRQDHRRLYYRDGSILWSKRSGKSCIQRGHSTMRDHVWKSRHFLCLLLLWFHYLLNVVTEKGTPGAVLIRAVRPVMGIDEMISRRRTKEMGNLASGRKLTSAFGIEIKDNGKDLTDPSGDIGIFKNKKQLL